MRLQAVAILLLVIISNGCSNSAEYDRAQAQVQRIVDNLDRRTTATGVYVRVNIDEVKEIDPWGMTIQVAYSQGGVAEVVSVRSAGPDGEFQTDDDIVAEGMTANLKGVGEGIKKNAEEIAASTAKGIVKGTVEGVKESIKDSLPFKKKKNAVAKAQQGAQPKPN
jgi:hypothetical protein